MELGSNSVLLTPLMTVFLSVMFGPSSLGQPWVFILHASYLFLQHRGSYSEGAEPALIHPTVDVGEAQGLGCQGKCGCFWSTCHLQACSGLSGGVFINRKKKLCLLKYSLPGLRLRGDPTMNMLWIEKGHEEEDLMSLNFPSNLVQD